MCAILCLQGQQTYVTKRKIGRGKRNHDFSRNDNPFIYRRDMCCMVVVENAGICVDLHDLCRSGNSRLLVAD